MGFTIILPNNSSLLYYPNNQISHFTTHLPKELTFDTKYEVALTEIIYSNNVFNIVDSYIIVKYKKNDINYTKKCALINSLYENISDFCRMCTNSMLLLDTDIKSKVDFSPLDDTSKKVYIRIKANNNEISLKIPKKLAHQLGFQTNDPMIRITESTYSDGPYNIFKPINTMYIYTNIIERQIVGDNLLPLLRSIPIKKERINKHSFTEFDHLCYLPVCLNNISSIEIYIKNEYNEIMPFQSGEVIVSLHFRKSSS